MTAMINAETLEVIKTVKFTSEESPTTLWWCSGCKIARTVEACPFCHCRCGEPKVKGRSYCVTHEEVAQKQREQELADREAKTLAKLTPVEYDGECMVYDNTSDRWYTDLEQAVDDIEYSEGNVADHVLLASAQRLTPIPDLAEYVLENAFEDLSGEVEPPEFTDETLADIKALEERLSKELPMYWWPTSERIITGSDR